MMYEDNNTVSVIIPLYNAEKYIRETIESVIAQDYPNIEIIIVDDCSTDGSQLIVKKMCDKYPNIIYHKLDVNSGVAIARNEAIKLAKGRFIAFCDSDDVWEKDKLVIQLKLFEKHSNVPFTYTAVSYIDEESNAIKGKRKVKEKASYSYLLRNTMIATSTVIIDRAVVNEIKMPNRKSAEDYSLWLSLLKKYGDAYGIDEAFTKYRKTSNSLSSNRVGEVKYFFDVQRNDRGINCIAVTINTICYIFNAVKKHFF